MSDDVSEHVVRLRDDAEGWRRVDGPELTPDDPFLTGLGERQAEALVRSNWALRRSDADEARQFYGGGVGPLLDPGEYTVDELETELAENELTEAELDSLAAAEVNGKNRETALEAIEEARTEEA